VTFSLPLECSKKTLPSQNVV